MCVFTDERVEMAAPPLLLDVLERFAQTMTQTFEVNDVLAELADNVVTVLQASGAGISVATSDPRLQFVSATNETVVEIERAQDEQQNGPCVEAYRTRKAVAISKLDELDRWPEYRAAAERCGFNSVVGIPIAIDEYRLGSLDVYDTESRIWSETDLRAAQVLANIATVYIRRAGQLAEARQLSEQLQLALDSRVVIEQAKGMIAKQRTVSVDQAFHLLRSYSRRESMSLRDVAAEVVDRGLDINADRR